MSLIDECKIIEFKKSGDSRGELVAIEGAQNIPFDIKRVFYIFDVDKEAVRGKHANRNSEFVFVCLRGNVKIRVVDKLSEKIIKLDSPYYGLYVPKMLWKDMYDFSDDAVLLVLASTHYDSEEYIRDYDVFISETESEQ